MLEKFKVVLKSV